jgi:LPXTG-motif cell wall-anchored protein
MSTNKRTTMSFLAVLAATVGVIAFLAGPAAADDSHAAPGLTSGTAWADNGSVASGSAIAINDSTASGDAVAIDGSVASGCSTATWESTASGGCDGDHHDGDDDGHHKKAHHATPASAKGGSGSLALTGSSTSTMVMVAGFALFAGALLVGVTAIRRRNTTA